MREDRERVIKELVGSGLTDIGGGGKEVGTEEDCIATEVVRVWDRVKMRRITDCGVVVVGLETAITLRRNGRRMRRRT